MPNTTCIVPHNPMVGTYSNGLSKSHSQLVCVLHWRLGSVPGSLPNLSELKQAWEWHGQRAARRRLAKLAVGYLSNGARSSRSTSYLYFQSWPDSINCLGRPRATAHFLQVGFFAKPPLLPSFELAVTRKYRPLFLIDRRHDAHWPLSLQARSLGGACLDLLTFGSSYGSLALPFCRPFSNEANIMGALHWPSAESKGTDVVSRSCLFGKSCHPRH